MSPQEMEEGYDSAQQKRRQSHSRRNSLVACLTITSVFGMAFVMLWVGAELRSSIASIQSNNSGLDAVETRLSEIDRKLEAAVRQQQQQTQPSTPLPVKVVATPPAKCKRMIFTASSGHAGNKQLFDMLSIVGAGKFDVYYQSPPSMAGYLLQTLKRDGYTDTYELRKSVKIPMMQSQLSNSSVAWFDASHLFVAWYDVALDYWAERCDEVYVIVLRRYLPYVIHELATEDFWQHEPDWYHSADSKMALLPRPPISNKPREESVDGSILWYLTDVEMRIQQMKRRYSSNTVRFINVRIEELAKKTSVIRLINSLGLSEEIENKNSASTTASLVVADDHQHRQLSKEQEDSYVRAAEEFLDRYKHNGIHVPEMPSLISPDRL